MFACFPVRGFLATEIPSWQARVFKSSLKVNVLLVALRNLSVTTQLGNRLISSHCTL